MFTEYNEGDENGQDYSPCGRWRPGESDLNTFDMIHEFRLDQSESDYVYEHISEVVGSSSIQRAYHFEQETNLTISAHEAFPAGLPHQFSFECTFRADQPPESSWYLFHLTDSYEQSQLSVIMNPQRETLELSLPDANGELQRVEFYSNRLFESQWHKVSIGVTHDQAFLYVDCAPVPHYEGYYAPLLPRGYFDTTGGYLSVARLVSDEYTVPVSTKYMFSVKRLYRKAFI